MNTRIPFCWILFCIAGLAFASAVSSPARAQCEVTADPDPLFGTNVIAVAAEGDTLVAAFGPSPTFVRFYRRTPGGWVQEAELPAPGIAPTYLSISSMRTLAISGNRVIAVAATRNTDPAYIFVREGSSWRLETTLSYPPTGFVAADISGDFAAVSTPVALAGEAAAFVFERVDGVWTEHQRFICSYDSSNPTPRPISLGGDILAFSDDSFCNVVPAGAPSLRPRVPTRAANQSTPAQGRATIGATNEAASQALLSCSGQWWLVFRRTAEGWVDQTPASFGGNCHFSIDVHDGRIAAAGTHSIWPYGNAVAILDFDGAQWVVQQTIPLGDEPSHRRYPVLHLESDRLLVGIPGYGQPVTFAGSAKLFHWVGGSFSEVATFQSAAPAANDAFGFTVAFAGDEIAVTSETNRGYLIDISGCNGNGLPDACDVDCDGNTVPDDCECTATAAPLPEPEGLAKNRYISFVPPTTCAKSAIRVTLRSLHHPMPPNLPCCPAPDFAWFEAGPNCVEGPNGCVRWVGPPGTYVDSVNAGTTFTAAMLQCEPYYHDWSDIDVLHVTDREIVPSSIYDVDAIDEGCDAALAENFSAAIEVTTARWGDVVDLFQDEGAASVTQPNVIDVGYMVDRLKDIPAAPMRPRMQLQTSILLPGNGITVVEIGRVVDAVKGFAYPYAGPVACSP